MRLGRLTAILLAVAICGCGNLQKAQEKRNRKAARELRKLAIKFPEILSDSTMTREVLVRPEPLIFDEVVEFIDSVNIEIEGLSLSITRLKGNKIRVKGKTKPKLQTKKVALPAAVIRSPPKQQGKPFNNWIQGGLAFIGALAMLALLLFFILRRKRN